MKKIFPLILVILFLGGCGAPNEGEGKVIPTSTSPVFTASPTIPIAQPPETITAPTMAPNPTVTLPTRLPPDRWREWPVVPAVTARAIEIYRTGQAMGLDPRAFSKVGDCQSVKAAFMGYFDIPERFSLGQDYAYLQQTVDNFSGHFNTDGQAVKGGFNAAAVLSPLWADPHACLAGENPLECELRVTKPIIVIVSLEVWWEGRTAEEYANLMRRILDTIINQGAVPILATKADNVEGDNSLNLATARLATEYDLPLWNFWAAVQSLPAHGMDINRNDGFHISTDAWSTRSFTGLLALDSIWRGLVKAALATAAAPSVDQTATPGSHSISTQNLDTPAAPAPGAISPGNSEQIVFGLAQRQGEGYSFPGVYLFNPVSRKTSQIFGPGVRFQSASADGKYLLVSEGSVLYRTSADGMASFKLTDSLYALGNTVAIWLSDGKIAAILSSSERTRVSILSADGSVVGELPESITSPVEIYPSSNGKYIYWESGVCSSPGVCQRTGAYVSSLDGSMNLPLNGITAPALAPDGSLLVSGASSTSAQNNLVFAAPDGTAPRPYPLPGNLLVDYAWSPAGDSLAAVVAIRSDYSGKVTGNRNFLIDPHTLAISEYPQSNFLNPRLVWSPDGSRLIWIGTIPAENGFMISGSLVSRNSKQVSDLGNAINLSSQDFLAITNADWLPLP